MKTLHVTLSRLAWIVVLLSACTGEKSKSEWACLQQADATIKNETLETALIFKSIHGLEIVGIWVAKHNRRVWVLLNPQAEPYYKQIPYKIGFELSEKQIVEIESRNCASSTVLAVLYSHSAK
jgi:hypothetical protein